jgi:hypothetical protein
VGLAPVGKGWGAAVTSYDKICARPMTERDVQSAEPSNAACAERTITEKWTIPMVRILGWEQTLTRWAVSACPIFVEFHYGGFVSCRFGGRRCRVRVGAIRFA